MITARTAEQGIIMRACNIGIMPQVATTHFVSHLHIMTLPALLPILPSFLGVGYIELGIALSIFNIVSAVSQAPMGYVTDHYGAKRILVSGLALGSMSFLAMAIAPSYACLLITMILAGVANAVYHPANYALLSQGINPIRMGKAFSIHTFAGFLGAAIAPALLLGVVTLSGPRAAFVTTSVMGLAALAFLLITRTGFVYVTTSKLPEAPLCNIPNRRAKQPLTHTIGVLILLFLLLSLSSGGIEKFSVTALLQGQTLTLTWANAALTAFLFASAFGVLFGGVLADQTIHHGSVAAVALACASMLVGIVTLDILDELALVVALGVAGFLTGLIAPSRDMLVLAAAPKGKEGQTFGIVSMGFSLGGIIGPILYGSLLDRDQPNGVLWFCAAFMVLTVILAIFQERHIGQEEAPRS